MSAITIETDLIHYEVLGRGKPVILVHGWLGSWRYWVPTMQQLSTKFRAYALDLWGFGDSGRELAKYGLKDQVLLLSSFMERLGITKAALVGHSFGAAVCLNFARQFPDRAPKVLLVSTPFELSGLVEALRPMTTTATPATTLPSNTGSTARSSSATSTMSTVTTTATTPEAASNGDSNPVKPAASTVPTVPAVTTPSGSPSTTIAANAPSGATSTVPVPPPVTTPAPATAPVTPPVTPPPFTSTSETIPRNPLRAYGNTAEEILRNLSALNQSNSSALGQAGQSGQSAQPASTGQVGKPSVTPQSTPPPPAASAQPGQPGTTPSPVGSTGTTATPGSAPSNQTTPAAQAASTSPQVATTSTTVPAASTPTAPSTPTPAATPAATVPGTGPLAGSSSSQRTAAPLLPTSIGTVVGDLPVRSEGATQLISVLTSNSPVNLLAKYIDRDAPDYEKLKLEVEKTDERAIIRTAQSFANVNLVDDAVALRLPFPVLMVHGEQDKLLKVPSEDVQKRLAANERLVTILAPARHFPMLEIAAQFNRFVMDFLEAPDAATVLSNIQNKEQWQQWRRTMR